ncbi:MAG: MmcQ/YjbR family DNA-binding protein [Schleiferiaceae bacterium]|jgi:predicted DNA-binding protein (MmcQ/YjbR family)|nr:MmcQ/YjbR family DNA-binding protein [Flavobacteriales bacterium]MDO7566561.1 MmcQ/YjbR family DNA-binding protein [Schleiferiaceae bacterium]NCF58091.1 MmcQ/YjbR family DNA-binding protein [Bacteroidota bacterium]NCG43878.1 MmcQ/YjbR family DNA-binding protein [Pseudomonadota bacterium]MDO7584138.1 MmcQ/YjbR family DNA-binding protein [Schleiferiaceae bacterium]
MTQDEAISYCESLPQSEASFPFDETTLVFKVANKLFAIFGINGENRMTLKFDPDELEQLKESEACITRTRYLSARHWASVTINELDNTHTGFAWINDSYNLVILTLPKKIQSNYPLLS